MKAALVNAEGRIENIIELPDNYDPEDETAYSPPDHLTLVRNASDAADIGGTYLNGVWTAPEPQEQPPQQDALEQRIATLEDEVRGMKERAANVNVTNADAVKVRDAVAGPKNS